MRGQNGVKQDWLPLVSRECFVQVSFLQMSCGAVPKCKKEVEWKSFHYIVLILQILELCHHSANASTTAAAFAVFNVCKVQAKVWETILYCQCATCMSQSAKKVNCLEYWECTPTHLSNWNGLWTIVKVEQQQKVVVENESCKRSDNWHSTTPAIGAAFAGDREG